MPLNRASSSNVTRFMPGNPRLLTPGLIAGFAAIVIVIVAARIINSSNFRDVYTKSDAVTHTYVVKGALDRLLATLVDAESGERGFIITGEPQYLEPYNHATSATFLHIAELRKLTADNPEHQADIDRLQAQAVVKLNELTEAIQKRRESGMAAAQAMVRSHVGKNTMERMRDIVAAMDAREDDLLAMRTIRAEQSYRSAMVTAFLSTGLSLLVVLALFLSTRQSGRNRLRAIQDAERLRVTLASIGDAVIVTDDQGRITRLNPIAEALTGWTDLEASGKRLEEVFVIVNENSRLPAENPIGKVLREKTIVGLANHTILISRDGREIPIDDSAAPIKAADGSIGGVIMVFRDITERRKVERERSALVAAERQANRAKDEFLALLSHELRTPLSSILGWATILRSNHLSPERTSHALEVIERNARLEVQLVESLLDLSRIVAGKLKLEMERVDLSSLVRAAVDSLQPVADTKELTVDVVIPSSPVHIAGDAARLQQVLTNLLGNAVKFTPARGRIQLRLNRINSQAEIQIIDNGEGIAPDLIPIIFDRFRQAESAQARVYGGLGLGLAIVRELVHAHGGTVTANSPGKGRGSTFTVMLPIPAVIPAQTESAPVHASQVDEHSISALRVLVVDDDSDARELVALTLQSRGAAVRTAASAAEAWEIINREDLDVLVSDIGMPHEDGYSLIRKIRALEQKQSRRSLPAIALTAYAGAAAREQVFAAGFDKHLAKPVSPLELTNAIAQIHNKRLSA